MNLSDLKPPKGAVMTTKRVGRGLGSGLGKTSGRGHKGQRARSSGNVRPGFEGGQQPLYRRIPKFGFKNPFRVEYQPVNVRDLEQAAKHATGGVVDGKALEAAGLIHHSYNPVKILGTGELKAKLTVKVEAFSAEAKKKIEAAGGKIEVVLLEGAPVDPNKIRPSLVSKQKKPKAKKS